MAPNNLALSPVTFIFTSQFPSGSVVKNLYAKQETEARSLGQEDPLEEDTEPTQVFWPEKSHGQRSLVGYSLKGYKESDTTEHPHTEQNRINHHQCLAFIIIQIAPSRKGIIQKLGYL